MLHKRNSSALKCARALKAMSTSCDQMHARLSQVQSALAVDCGGETLVLRLVSDGELRLRGVLLSSLTTHLVVLPRPVDVSELAALRAQPIAPRRHAPLAKAHLSLLVYAHSLSWRISTRLQWTLREAER